MKLGVVSSIYGASRTYADAAAITKAAGFDGVQLFLIFKDLVLFKQGSHVDLTPLTSELREAIYDAYATQNLGIFGLSCYTNLTEPDENEWSKNVEYLRALINCAHDFGTDKVVTETGVPGVGAFERVVAALKSVAPDAEAAGVSICIEPSYAQIVPNSHTAAGLLAAVGSDAVKIVLDPANILGYDDVERMFTVLGSSIVLGHAKDCIVEYGGRYEFPSAGGGMVPYHRYVELLLEYGIDTLVIEYANEGNIDQVAAFLRGVIADVEGK